jgi:hypothetical protein
LAYAVNEAKEGFFMAQDIPVSANGGSSSFRKVAAAFLASAALPFAGVLSAEKIERVFAKHNGLFGQHAIYSTPMVVWSFLGQSQKPGVGLPIARAVAILSLATAAVMDVAVGPYAGKQTGESALLRQLFGRLGAADIAVMDRYYCSFMMIALLLAQGTHVCARKHQRGPSCWPTT